jgi:hypothetical protein
MDETTRTAICDYIVLTTHRKHEQKGAKWSGRPQDLYADREAARTNDLPLPTAGFAGAAAFGPERRPRVAHDILAWDLAPTRRVPLGTLGELAGGVARTAGLRGPERLAALLTYAAAPLRWELDKNGSLHAGIPSPSSLFLTEIIVLGRGKGGVAHAARYLPHSHQLAQLCGVDADTLLGDAQLAFVIVGHLDRCLAPYGEFSPCLAALEAGHLQAQLTLLCAALGWKGMSEVCPGDAALAAALCLEHWTRVPLVRLTVSGPLSAQAWPAGPPRDCREARLAPQWTNADDFPRLTYLLNAIRNERPRRPAVPGELRHCPVPIPPAVADQDLGDVISRRTSGRHAGLAPFRRQLDLDQLQSLVATAACLPKAGADMLSAVEMSALFSVKNSTDGSDGGYVADLMNGTLALPDATDPARHHLRTRSAPTRERSLVITFAVDDLRELDRWGAAGFLISHLAAGAYAQRLSLGAAAIGMFARPIRAYPDFMADLALPLNRRSIYQLVCCFEPRNLPYYDLL